MERESRTLVVFKGLVLAAASLLFLAPLATPPGLVAGVLGTFGGVLLADRLGRSRIRRASWVLVGLASALLGQLLGTLMTNLAPLPGPSATLMVADVFTLGLGTLGAFCALRLASARYRLLSVLELAVVLGSVGHAFADHRHSRIHQPRFLSDWAWSYGIEPESVLEVLGVIAIALAALLLLRVRRASRVLSMLALLLAGGLAIFLIAGAPRLGNPKPDDLGLNGESNDKDKNDKDKKGGGSSQKPPDPVAVAVLHDDLPDVDVLYFRQTVLSHLVGDRLIEDTSGQFDRDVPTSYPAGSPVLVTTPQVGAFHRTLHTSMYLLADHAQYPGLGFPTALKPLENPNPRRFVAAYDVDSQLALRPVERLLGRQALSPEWTEAEREHYLALPTDPRYLELSNRLVRDVDPRFVGDDVVKALAIRQYLEKKGFYSLEKKTLTGDDPTAAFLFGDLRGYCVHFAHAAVFLLRSQGIPARVATGYGVETTQRGAGSAVLIFGNQAHAWPELYLDGVGWVTFDIHPEQSDEPPPQFVEQDLESALGELARKDPTGGHADPSGPFVFPWVALGTTLGALAGLALLVAFGVKLTRRLSPRAYRAVLDGFADLGAARRVGETRERHAARLSALAPSFVPLTATHLRLALGSDTPEGRAQLSTLARATRAELRHNTPRLKWALGLLNPIGWWFTR